MIKLVAAIFLLLGSGIIFEALVAMDAPTLRPRPLARRSGPRRRTDDDAEVSLRRAA